MNGVRIAIFAAVLIIAGTAVHAQQGPGGQNAPDAKKREEVRKKVEAVRMWRLTEELRLDEKMSARLASFLSSIDEKRRGLMRERMETLRDLRVVVKTTDRPDEKKMKTFLEKLERIRAEMMELESKEQSGIKDILTVEQQARYVVFQHEFRREMRGMIEGAREGGAGMRGPGTGGGMGPHGPGGPNR